MEGITEMDYKEVAYFWYTHKENTDDFECVEILDPNGNRQILIKKRKK